MYRRAEVGGALAREAIIDLILVIIVIALALVATGVTQTGNFGLPTQLPYLLLLLLVIPAARFVVEDIAWSNREYIVNDGG